MYIECGTVEIISIINAAHIQHSLCVCVRVMPNARYTNTWRKQPAWKKHIHTLPLISYLFHTKNRFHVYWVAEEKKKEKSENEINAHFMQQLILMPCLIDCAVRRYVCVYSVWNLLNFRLWNGNVCRRRRRHIRRHCSLFHHTFSN